MQDKYLWELHNKYIEITASLSMHNIYLGNLSVSQLCDL